MVFMFSEHILIWTTKGYGFMVFMFSKDVFTVCMNYRRICLCGFYVLWRYIWTKKDFYGFYVLWRYISTTEGYVFMVFMFSENILIWTKKGYVFVVFMFSEDIYELKKIMSLRFLCSLKIYTVYQLKKVKAFCFLCSLR